MIIGPAILLGVAIAIIELIMVHSDEQLRGWLKHGWHAAIFAFIGVFINMNLGYVLGLIGFADTPMYEVLLQIAVTLIIGFKVFTASKFGHSGRAPHESFVHMLIVMALIFGAPYIWNLVLEPIIGSYIPF